MMANLLSNNEGRELLYKITCFLGRERMSLGLKRKFYRAWKDWQTSGSFSLQTLLGSLNEADQDHILSIGNMLGDLGCFEGSTYDNLTIYVNADTGSDETGDGTQANPYQSLTFITSGHFPFFINHQVRILISGNVGAESLHFPQVIGPFGSLSIIGVGSPDIVTTSAGAGPFTATGATAFTPGPIAGWEFSLAETLVVDELYGKWIRFEDGNCAGQALPVHENTANRIYTRAGWNGTPLIGDTFRIIEPKNTITCSTFDFELKGPTFRYTDYRAARFNLVNLKLDITVGLGAYNQFRVRNSCHSNISFCTLVADAGMSGYCVLQSPLNYYFSWDTSVESLSQSGLSNLDERFFGNQSNCGLQLYREDWPAVSFSPEECRICNPAEDIIGLDARGRVVSIGQAGALHQSAIGYHRWDGGGAGATQQCLLSGRADGPCVDINQGAFVELNVNYFQKGRDCVEVKTGDVVLNQNAGAGAPVFTGHGIRFVKAAGRVTTEASPAALTGTGGDILFNAGVGTTAYPIADAQATDALGNYVSWINT